MSSPIRTNVHWDDKKKVEVVTTYLAVGKYALVEALTGVPKNTIQAWRKQPWFEELMHEIQQESDQELDVKLQKIVDKSLDVVVDRLENGDFILNSKTGEIVRNPVKMKDAHKISVEILDKRDLIRNRQRVHVEVQAVEDYLKKLAGQFAEFVKRKAPKVIEGESHEIKEEASQANPEVLISEEIKHAIHEERQEGLQAGSSEVHQSS